MYIPKEIIRTEDQIRTVIDGEFESQTGKIIDHIDDLCRAWIERSPFLVMATHDASGGVDVSPKGDPAGFVKVLDHKTLAVPDRPGNHRFDGFLNILATGRIGLVFMVPGRNEVVRVNGSAVVARDLDLREQMAINGRVPDFAIVVTVEEAFYHCGKAVIRSRLWSPEYWADPTGLPTYAQALKTHAQLDRDMDDLEAALKHNDEHRLYDE